MTSAGLNEGIVNSTDLPISLDNTQVAECVGSEATALLELLAGPMSRCPSCLHLPHCPKVTGFSPVSAEGRMLTLRAHSLNLKPQLTALLSSACLCLTELFLKRQMH